jgi:hypothetical protein
MVRIDFWGTDESMRDGDPDGEEGSQEGGETGKNLEKFVGVYRIASPAQIKKDPAPWVFS